MSSSVSIRKGVSRSKDPAVAAAELHKAIAQRDTNFAVFYCAHDYDLPTLARELGQRFGDTPLIGCTTAGEITPQGYLDGSLTGCSIASANFKVATQLIPLEPFDSVAIGKQVTQQMSALGAEGVSAQNTFAFLLIDGLAMQEESFVSRVHALLNGVNMIGGSAGDSVRFQSTSIYYQGRFHQNVAVLSLIRSDLPFVPMRTQHFIQSDKRMVVTRADPSRRIVHEINGKSAAREFARLLGKEIDELSPMIFATHPVVVRISGQYFVRSIAKTNPDESLTFFCAIDTGIVLTIAKGVDMVDNLQQAFEDVRSKIGTPQLVLGCDCILRNLEATREGFKDRIGRIFADNNVIGFSTYGEQFNAMHVNQTFTGIAIGAAG